MNIFDFCDRFNISLAKARRMEKANVLRLDENTPDEVQEIRHLLLRGQPLSASHLAGLIENPGWKMDLGKYADKALAALAPLGDALDEKAPLMVSAYIADAAGNDPHAQGEIIAWLRKIIPRKPVPYNYVAVRLILGIPPIDRVNDIPRIPRVLLNVRKHESFSGYWRLVQNGTRNATVFCAPGKNSFDL